LTAGKAPAMALAWVECGVELGLVCMAVLASDRDAGIVGAKVSVNNIL